ncbi:MAG: sigma-70 family RNA polymerase sigma factor [Sphingobacteriales bacterium]|nr:sigma-70 family RNA polymerase sigma factor [Sphingobacteriales bacterium]
MRQLKIQNQITVREGPALEKYLNDISKLKLLTADEETDLARKTKQGDEVALAKLVNHNLRFVVSVAKQYQNQGLHLADLINEGNLGLIKAANRFDETKGFKFISYAVWWIRQAIMHALVEKSRLIRLPLNKVESYKKIYHELLHFLQDNQREPSIDELAELVDISKDDIRLILKAADRPVSTDDTIGNDDDSTTLLQTIESNDEHTPDESLMSVSLKEEIKNTMSILHPKEIEILNCFFGLNDNAEMNLDDISERMGLTRERVRQIKDRALRRLRKTSLNSELRAYLGK